jgi:hypothetical protein
LRNIKVASQAAREFSQATQAARKFIDGSTDDLRCKLARRPDPGLSTLTHNLLLLCMVQDYGLAARRESGDLCDAADVSELVKLKDRNQMREYHKLRLMQVVELLLRERTNPED